VALIDLLKLLTSARPVNFSNRGWSEYFSNPGWPDYYIKTLYSALCETNYLCHAVVNALAQANRYRKQTQSV